MQWYNAISCLLFAHCLQILCDSNSKTNKHSTYSDSSSLSYNLSLARVDLRLLLQDGEPDTLALRQRDQWLVLLANDEHVCLSRDKGVVLRVLQLNDIKGTLVLLPLGHDANASAKQENILSCHASHMHKKFAQDSAKKACDH